MLFSTLFLAFIGCQNELPYQADVIHLQWHEGQEFHLASSHRYVSEKNINEVVSLENYQPKNQLFERWSEEIIWTYKVIEANFYPPSDDQLYDYSINTLREQVPLSVIKVSIDESLNTDPQILEMDPVFYLVFRQQRNRLAGIIEFINIDGQRTERAYTSGELERSWSILSQSNITMIPTYLAPFGARWSGGTRILENGSEMTATSLNKSTTDVVFADELGGELVSVRYEDHQPWPTWVVSANMEARLLSHEQIGQVRADLPVFSPTAPENFDYRAALSSSINLDDALYIHLEDIEKKGYKTEVYEGYKPWAGAWWPLKKGELVFGYEDRFDTFSRRVREDIDPLKNKMDKLSAELREIKEESDEKKQKNDEYHETQKQLVDRLIEFYAGIQRDLNGGKLRIENGKLIKDAVVVDDEPTEPAWEYDINKLSPMDKFALYNYLEGNMRHTNPFYLSAWEILNSYNPGGESWWGHCNGWAAAAILTHEPREEQTVSTNGHDFTFTTADLKGLLTESHYSTYSRFYGERYNGEDDDVSDLSPAHFQKLINFYIREQGVPFVFDTTATEAVWNFPVYEVDFRIDETTTNTSQKTNINKADLATLQALDELDEDQAKQIIDYRTRNGNFQSIEELEKIPDMDVEKLKEILSIVDPERNFSIRAEAKFTSDGVDADHIDGTMGPESFTKVWSYTLVTTQDGMVLRGEWKDDESHPDFAWVPYNNPRSAASNDSENPYLRHGDFLDIFSKDIEK